MATTTKKGSKNKKAKLRRPSVETSLVKQVQTHAELRQQLAESLQRENATAKELQDCKRQLAEALEQQIATSEISGVIASSPTDIQPVLDTIAKSAAQVCSADDAVIRLVERDGLRLAAHHGSIRVEVPVRPIDRDSAVGRLSVTFNHPVAANRCFNNCPVFS